MGNRAILLILDGFGIGKNSSFNAIQNAHMPFYRQLCSQYPHSQLLAHGEAVGLPPNVMGNSEVGHMTLGAGRILYQDLTRISKSIREGLFSKNAVIQKALSAGPLLGKRVHLMGLLSDGGVHSHIDHLLALLDTCALLRIPEIYVHPFLDGRDTPPHSAGEFLKKLLNHPCFSIQVPDTGKTQAQLGSMTGRFYAMDRDQRWDRSERAFQTLCGRVPKTSGSVFEILENFYQTGKGDEFVEPVLLTEEGAVRAEDSVFFFNFRSDRARQITQCFHEARFQPPKLSSFATMTSYDNAWTTIPHAFPPQRTHNIFGEWLEKNEKSQYRIAETEKYAHVTFFFNAGRENAFSRETRVLVPSIKEVPTYDLKPEMSAFAIASQVSARIQEAQDDFILMNFANADMVGHTGNYEATLRAMEALDICLAQVLGAAEKSGYHTLLTADHGNAEEMRDDQGRNHTQHTLNPVPLIYISPDSANAPKSNRLALRDGGLSDVMPTLCELMGMAIPEGVSGRSLIPQSRSGAV